MLFLFFFGIISAMSTFCFSFRELKRAVSKPDTNVMSTSWLSILLVSTIFLAVSAVYIYGFWGFSREVELVHDRLVRRGTVALLEQTKARYEDLLRQQLGEASSVSLEEMESAVDAIISAMRANAEDFLDWYYGPRGEIFRTAQRTLGRLRSNRDRYEQRMAARLSEFLLQEVPVDAYHVQWESFHRIAESLVEVTVDQFNLERDQIIRANTIVSDVTGPTSILEHVESPKFKIADKLRESLAIRREAFLERQNSSVVAGAVSGAVAGTVVGSTLFRKGVRGVDKLIGRLPRVMRPFAKAVFLSRVVSLGTGDWRPSYGGYNRRLRVRSLEVLRKK